MTRIAALLALVLPLLLPASAAAHAHWLLTETPVCATGDGVTLVLGAGHAFPASEMAEDPDESPVFAFAPDGVSRPLRMSVDGTRLVTRYAPEQPGCHRVYLAVDRGVISRTEEGWQDGGRDVWPETDLSLNYFIGAMTWVMAESTAWASAPLGLPLELQVEAVGDEGVELRAYRSGEPAAHLEIRLWQSGSGFAPIGATDGGGRFRVAGDLLTGEHLFISATHTADHPEGDPCDRDMLRFNVVIPGGLLPDRPASR